MADVFTNDLRIREQEVGANSGSWGSLLNSSLSNLAESLSYGTEALADSATQTLTLADGASDELRSLYLKLTGTLSQATTVTIAPNTISKCWIIENATSGGYDVTISQGSGANVTVGNGNVKMIATDGAGAGAVVHDLLTDLELAGNVSITTADNTTQLTLTSTDADANNGPVLDLFRDSGSPADDDLLGKIRFLGDSDAGGQLTYAAIETRIADASNGSEDGRIEFNTAVGGSGNVSRILIGGTETVVNDDSKDLDFRVESDANTHAIFLEASSDKLGIGVSSPIARLSLPAQALGDNGIARFAIESAVDNNDFMISQYEDTSGTYTLIGQNLGLNSTGSDTILDGGHRTAAIRLDARGSGSIQFLTGNTNANAEAARFDQNGQLLHGTTAVPTGVLLGRQFVSSSATGAEIIAFRADTSVAVDDIPGAFLIGNSDTSGTEDHFVGMWARVTSANGSQELRFAAGRSGYEDNEPHLKIGSGGDVSLPSQVATGSLAQGRLEVVADSSSNCINTQVTTSGFTSFGTSGTTTSGGNYYNFGVMINSSGSSVGSIVVNHSGTTYNTTSDYRLKENVTELTNATTRLKQLQPKRFNFIEVPDKTVDGFLAHEVQSVVPEAITGTKDEVDDDGNAVYQGIDQSKLVPLLVAAIQEQQTLIETLQTKVAALEGA